MRAEDVKDLGDILLTGGVSEVGVVSQLATNRARRREAQAPIDQAVGEVSGRGDNGDEHDR